MEVFLYKNIRVLLYVLSCKMYSYHQYSSAHIWAQLLFFFLLRGRSTSSCIRQYQDAGKRPQSTSAFFCCPKGRRQLRASTPGPKGRGCWPAVLYRTVMQPIYCLYIQHFWPFGRGQQHFRPKGPEVLYIMSQQSQPFGPVVLVKSFMKSSKMCCLRLLYKNSVISVNEDLAVLFKHFKESVCHKHLHKNT